MTSEVGAKPAKELSATEYALVLAQEELVVDTQIAIHRLLHRRGLKQSDLAGLLGVSEARVSQLFGSDARNLTLRTIAKIYHVLGSACRVVEREAGEAVQDLFDEGAQETGDPMPGAEAARAGTNGHPTDSRDGSDWAHWMDELGAPTPELAAFPSGAVWILGGGPILVANENEPFRSRFVGRKLPGAGQWAVADARYASA